MVYNILTFREWKNEFVKVTFDLVGGVTVTSFDIRIIKSNDNDIINDLKDKQKILLNYYKKGFNPIQKKYLDTINKGEKLN